MLSCRNFLKDKNPVSDQAGEACHIWLENLKGKWIPFLPSFICTYSNMCVCVCVIHWLLLFSTEGSGITGPKDKLTVISVFLLFKLFFLQQTHCLEYQYLMRLYFLSVKQFPPVNTCMHTPLY